MTVPFAVPLWLGLRYALSSTPEQLALNFFFSSDVRVPRHPEAPSDLVSVLASPYTHAPRHSALSSAVTALALAAFYGTTRHLSLFHKARVRYGEALEYVKVDLRDSVAIRRNETLMSILVLGIVEVSEQIPIIHILKPVRFTQKRDVQARGPIIRLLRKNAGMSIDCG